MTTPYAPKIGDILTGVDARGVRGPARVTAAAADGVFTVRFDFPHVEGNRKEWMSGNHWRVQPDGEVAGTGMRVLFEPWQEPAAEPATRVTTIGDIAGKVKPGTVVAVHLVVVTPSLSETWPLTLRDHGGAFHAPTRDTPCTIISEPEPEPWKAGDEAVWDGKPVTVFAINRDKAWLELSPHANGGPVVPLAELERPQ